jgi:hypothetical protein
MIDTLVRRKGGGAVRSPLDLDQHQDAAKAPFANFRFQLEAAGRSRTMRLTYALAASSRYSTGVSPRRPPRIRSWL